MSTATKYFTFFESRRPKTSIGKLETQSRRHSDSRAQLNFVLMSTRWPTYEHAILIRYCES